MKTACATKLNTNLFNGVYSKRLRFHCDVKKL